MLPQWKVASKAAGELNGYLLDQLHKCAGLFGDAPVSKRFEVSFISIEK